MYILYISSTVSPLIPFLFRYHLIETLGQTRVHTDDSQDNLAALLCVKLFDPSVQHLHFWVLGLGQIWQHFVLTECLSFLKESISAL